MVRSLLALVLLGAGCTPDVCARNSDCAAGQVCAVTGLCVIPADASTDGHAGDAGSGATGDAPVFADAAHDGPPDSPLPQVRDDRRRW